MPQPLYIKAKITAKKVTDEALGRLGISVAGEELILQIRRRLTRRGRIKYQWRDSLDKLYSLFVQPGDLCFDVGANYGTRIDSFLRLGARVVAVEPLDQVMHYLAMRYRRNPRVTLVHSGLDRSDGSRVIYICANATGASSMSTELIEIQRVKDPTIEFSQSATVTVTTLDRLISLHGLPSFCKIDVEGFEFEVLRGLSHAIPKLSLEYTPERIRPVIDCIAHLSALGSYEYNYSVEESMVLARSDWVSAKQMPRFVEDVIVTQGGTFGDIYARLTDAPRVAQ
jgi:FkbM family methyltransferase